MADNTMNFERESRLRFAGVTEETSRLLRLSWTAIRPHLASILDGFYAHASTEPHLAKLVANQVARLKQTQEAHWERLFSGTFDQAYMEGVYRIGLAHKNIGLEPRWYIASYKYVLNRLVQIAVSKYRSTPKRMNDVIAAINTAVFLDMDLAIAAYLDAIERAKAEQAAMIINSVGAGLEALANGDLTHRVTAALEGPFAKLKTDFNKALDRLQETMKTILAKTSGVSDSAGEIAQAADDLSRRTEQQAASLEETAAALEEITATVKKTAQNAKEASNIVSTAKGVAEDGGRVVETAVKAMGQIEHSSKQITDIISVIDEIAFQTNLLALNAGVEAARAGDAGKGFAVVASEVRALAQRSSEAAKEIKGLIKESGEHVGLGVKYVGESGDALKRIVDQVVQINALVTEMAEAAQQQSTGIEEVNSAVSQMDQVTQQNAAMVEESTAASRSLASEAAALSELVSFFDVGVVAAEPTAQAQPTAPSPAKPRQKPVAAVTPATRGRPQAALRRRNGGALPAKPKGQPEEEQWSEF